MIVELFEERTTRLIPDDSIMALVTNTCQLTFFPPARSLCVLDEEWWNDCSLLSADVTKDFTARSTMMLSCEDSEDGSTATGGDLIRIGGMEFGSSE